MTTHELVARLQGLRARPDLPALDRALWGEPGHAHVPTRAALVRSVALELELTASHLRRVLEEASP